MEAFDSHTIKSFDIRCYRTIFTSNKSFYLKVRIIEYFCGSDLVNWAIYKGETGNLVGFGSGGYLKKFWSGSGHSKSLDPDPNKIYSTQYFLWKVGKWNIFKYEIYASFLPNFDTQHLKNVNRGPTGSQKGVKISKICFRLKGFVIKQRKIVIGFVMGVPKVLREGVN